MTQIDPPRSDASHDKPTRSFVLHVVSPSSEWTQPLDRPRAVVGRGDDCDIVVDDPTVSRRHLVLELDGTSVRFRDLGGTNVPVLDGRSVREGRFAPGSTLVVGLSRMTLAEATGSEETRVLSLPLPTSRVLHRVPAPPTHGPGNPDPRALLQAFHRPHLRGPEFVSEVAPHLLACALGLTGRTRGVIATVESPGTLRVIASVPADPAAFALPGHVLGEVLEPLCVDPWPVGPAERDRVIVPLDAGPHRAVLVLGVPEKSAPPGQVALETAIAFGRIASRELAEAAARERDGHELRRLRFSQSYASRTVLASTRLQTLRRRVTAAARDGEPVLLLGEEGCEAEEIAAFYHANAARSSSPFVACYARLLPPHRIAQELARDLNIHEEGGNCAVRARGGTLFVDSPEALPPELQRRLAEIITTNKVEPPDTQFRIVLSMVRDDDDRRPRLHHSLEEILRDWDTTIVPPLRGFPEDVAALTEIVLDEMGPTAAGLPRRVSEDANGLLRGYQWPGNTRQHRRVVESAAARAGTEVIGARHLPEAVREPATGDLRIQPLRDVERIHVYRVLSLCGDNKERAARKLGISPSTLHGKLMRYEQEG